MEPITKNELLTKIKENKEFTESEKKLLLELVQDEFGHWDKIKFLDKTLPFMTQK